jgi:cyclase
LRGFFGSANDGDKEKAMISRREFVKRTGAAMGAVYAGGILAGVARGTARGEEFVRSGINGIPLWRAAQAATGGQAADPVMQMRAYMSGLPVVRQKLRDNFYVLSGPGGNIGLLTGPDGALYVDSGMGPAHDRLVASATEVGAGAPKLLVNTHFHFDHTDGNLAMHQAGATIVAQENTRKRLSAPYTMEFLEHTFPASPEGALPVMTFAEGTTLYMSGEEIDVIGVKPAHTDSDVFLHFTKNNVIHTGDLLFNGFYPLIDYSAQGNIEGMIAAAERILPHTNSDTVIIPGHGPVGIAADLKASRDMLTTVNARVEKLVAAGRTNEQIAAVKPTADLDAKWGNGFLKPEQFVSMVAEGIRQHKKQVAS